MTPCFSSRFLSCSLSQIPFLLPLFCALLLCAVGARAEEARPLADDPVAEKRLLDIAGELRCLVCQNETLAASNADLANDLRREIRAMIGAGKTNEEILDFMVSRYGDFVLYRPPFKASTWLLWLAPPLFVLFGLLFARGYLARRSQRLSESAPLSGEALQAARQLLAEKANPNSTQTQPKLNPLTPPPETNRKHP